MECRKLWRLPPPLRCISEAGWYGSTKSPLRRDPMSQQLRLPLSRFCQGEIGAAPEALRFYAFHVTVANQ